MNIDYKRLDYEQRAHHIRFARRANRDGLLCQACNGMGGETEPLLDDYTGPWIMCGWCEGTGKTTKWLRGFWLRSKK